jgi:hypothetical protein
MAEHLEGNSQLELWGEDLDRRGILDVGGSKQILSHRGRSREPGGSLKLRGHCKRTTGTTVHPITGATRLVLGHL